uniref:NIPSNAP domain-containing protein n=1 Tax=Heterorhabditis bacteriophora TaxID=37862 RepID=A0A1I7XTX4_HETBA
MNRAGIQFLATPNQFLVFQNVANFMVITISRKDVLQYDTFLFDADGVLWTGDYPVPCAIDFISNLLQLGKQVFILTNNSTKTIDQYMNKLSTIGFSKIKRDNVISPAIVLADYLKNNSKYDNQLVYLLGTENLKSTLELEGGVRCFGTGPDHLRDYTEHDFINSVDLSIIPKAVICSYDSHFSYPKLMKAANFLNQQGVEFLVTNEDYTFPGPVPGIIIPGSGCTSACLRAVSGRDPIVFGKPHEYMANYLKQRHHIDPTTTIMFGDRLDTDIKFANDNGFASCLMLTGVHSLEDSGQQIDPSGWQKQSHSSLLSTSENIYEITTHNFRPGEQCNYLDAFGKYKQELAQKLPSVELVGSWTVSYGRTRDQAIHLWRYNKGYKDVDKLVSKSIFYFINLVSRFNYLIERHFEFTCMILIQNCNLFKSQIFFRIVPLIKKMQSKILTPTEFSQLK